MLRLALLLLMALSTHAWASPCQSQLIDRKGYLLEWENDVRLSKVKALTFADLVRTLSSYRVTLMGDVHTVPEPQQKFVELIKAFPRDDGRPTYVVIEFLGGRFQAQIDAYLAGEISLEQLHGIVLADNPGYFHQFPWATYSKILIAAKNLGYPVLVYDWVESYNSMEGRDRVVAQRLAHHAFTHRTARYLVHYGQSHVLGSKHLYGWLKALGLDVASVLVFLHSRAQLFSQLWPKELPAAAALDQDIYWLQTLSPLHLEQIQQYLRAMEAWIDDSDTD